MSLKQSIGELVLTLVIITFGVLIISAVLGLMNIWTDEAGKPRDPMVLLIGVVLSASIISLILRGVTSKKLWDQTVSLLGLSILFVCGGIALWASQTSLGSNVSYVKVATYLTPLFLLIIGERMSENLQSGKAKNPNNDTPLVLRMAAPVFFVVIMLLSVTSTNSAIIKKPRFSVPAAMTQIVNNKDARAELSNYNYLTAYQASSSVLGFVGDVHWVSKAPNDQRLETRMENEMRIICFTGDNSCAPKTPEIIVSSLNKFGFRIVQSPVSTAQFSKLAQRERYFAAMDAVGQARFELPEHFIGGNPLLKPST